MVGDKSSEPAWLKDHVRKSVGNNENILIEAMKNDECPTGGSDRRSELPSVKLGILIGPTHQGQVGISHSKTAPYPQNLSGKHQQREIW